MSMECVLGMGVSFIKARDHRPKSGTAPGLVLLEQQYVGSGV